MRESTSVALTLPDPQTVALGAVKETVIPRAALLREAIRERGAVAEARELARRLEAYRTYLQDREGRDLLAAEARRTEILIGELLGPGEHVQSADGRFTISPAGDMAAVPRQDAYRFRLLAAHADQVEAWLTQERPVVSRTALLEKIKRLEENETRSGATGPEVRAGDFRSELESIPDGAATLVLTDPPYGDAALSLYDDLGAFSRRVLRPGGSLICYTGQSILPDVLRRLGAHLRYWWVLALTHRHGGQQLPGKWVIAEWKPVVWFVNDHRLGREYVPDVLRGSSPEKAHHEWAQGIEEVVPLLERLTEPGELVVDPFAGSGAFGRAALGLGRRFVGADLDPQGDQGRVA